MQSYQNSLLRVGGYPLSGASILVKTSSGATASIFSDNLGTPTANPLTSDPLGNFQFWATDGVYSLVISSPGLVTQTITGVHLEDQLSIDTGTSTDATPLNGAEFITMSRGAGLLQSTLAKVGAWCLQTYQSFTQTGTGAVARAATDKLSDVLASAKDFGAKGDGVTDDTAALQALINNITANNRRGFLPKGNYLISSSLLIPASNRWALSGEVSGGSTITQAANNVPILNYGGGGGITPSFGAVLTDITFTYTNTQSGNTSANCIFFSQSWWNTTFERLNFNGGYYGIAVLAGQVAPWGCYWNDLQFGSALYGGAMNWTGATGGVPNNVWGRIGISAQNMVGPVFNNIRGYNWTIDAIEILAANLGPQLITMASGAICTIGAIKLEIGIYTTGTKLLQFNNGSHVRIGQFNLGGNTVTLNPSSGVINLFGDSGGALGYLEIGTCWLQSTTLGSNVYIIGTTGPTTIKDLVFADAANWQVANFSGSTTDNILAVSQWKNDQMFTTDNGDADYTSVLGDPTIVRFETTLTAPRTINLDSNGNNLFSGMYREFRIKGAINGANTITVKCNSVTLATLSSDCAIRFTFSRIDGAHVQNCWKVTKYSTSLPA